MKKKLLTIFSFIIAFLIPFGVFLIVLKENGIAPFGDSTILFVDSQGQYVAFLSYYKTLFTSNNDFFYTFAKPLGGDMLSLFCYYLFSPFNFIYLFVSSSNLPIAMSIVTSLKIGTIGVTMHVLMNHLYKEKYISNLIFSVSYALISYVIVYNFNIMFLDAVLWTPLVILGLEKMFEGKKSTLYSIFLALAIISNYYTGFMICIFVVMFFLFKLYSEKREKSDIKNHYKNFACGSLVAGGLSTCAWLVAIINMVGSKTSINNRSLFTFNTLIELPNFLKNFVSNSYNGMNDIISGGPLVFIGITCLSFAIMYFANSKFSKDERLNAGIIIAIFVLCMFVSGLNNLFHGGSAPVWFPYRFAFLFDFFLIYLAARELNNIDGLKCHHFVLPLGIIITIYAILTINNIETNIILDFVFCLINLLIIFIMKNFKNKYVTIAGMSIMLICTTINMKSSASNNIATNVKETETGSSNYISYELYQSQYKEISSVINYVKEYDDTNEFYRMEKTFNSLATYNLANNDSFMFDYAGVSHYSSVDKLDTRNYIGNYLGFHTNGNWNSYGLGSTLTANSLMGIRYIIDRDNQSEGIMINNRHFGARDYLTKIKDFDSEADQIHVFKNDYALGLGYLANNRLETIGTQGVYLDEEKTQFRKYDIFEYQNQMYMDLTNKNFGNIFTPISYTVTYNNITKIDDRHYKLTNTSLPGYITFRLSIDDTIHKYPSYYHVSPGLSDYMALYESNYSSNNIYYFNMYNYGINPIELTNSQTQKYYTLMLKENLIWDDVEIIPSFYYENVDTLNNYYQELKANELQLKKVTSSHLKGFVIYNKEKTLLTTSIPYDKNWNVKINGKSIKTRVNQNIFLAVDLSNLNYQTGDVLNVDLSYHANEFTFALIISFISIAYILLYDYKYYEKIKEKFFNKKGKVKENSIKTNDATKSKKETDNGVA